MGRLKWTLTESQSKKFYSNCTRIGEIIEEKAGFVFRRIIWLLNDLLSSDISLDELKEGFDLIKKTHKEKNKKDIDNKG